MSVIANNPNNTTYLSLNLCNCNRVYYREILYHRSRIIFFPKLFDSNPRRAKSQVEHFMQPFWSSYVLCSVVVYISMLHFMKISYCRFSLQTKQVLDDEKTKKVIYLHYQTLAIVLLISSSMERKLQTLLGPTGKRSIDSVHIRENHTAYRVNQKKEDKRLQIIVKMFMSDIYSIFSSFTEILTYSLCERVFSGNISLKPENERNQPLLRKFWNKEHFAVSFQLEISRMHQFSTKNNVLKLRHIHDEQA